MSNNNEAIAIKFRCPAELEGKIPPPVPASLGLPGWLKSMPTQAFNAMSNREEDTVKRCPPFVDAMTSGFLMPLICDLKIENGEITWDNDLPSGGVLEFPRSPIGFHDESQVIGSPLFEHDRFLIKFINLWTIEAPAGYSLFFTHPVNRFDLPFTTLTGMVDCDLFHDSWIHFPARWHDTQFQRRPAQGHAGCAMFSGEARELGCADRSDDAGRNVARAGTVQPDGPRARALSPPVPDLARAAALRAPAIRRPCASNAQAGTTLSVWRSLCPNLA
ncbi:hypothetical protein ACVISU_004742 [Bradyrhizobium sp. USDA 4452]